jgi:hypothetical protein
MYASWYPGILARCPSLLFTSLLLRGLVTALVGRYPAGPPPTASAPAIKLAFQELPLSFVPNAGQAAPSIRFQVQDRGNSIFYTD